MPLMNLFELFQATSEIKYLEDQAKLLEENYETLKLKREILLAEKERKFHGIFSSFLRVFVIECIS